MSKQEYVKADGTVTLVEVDDSGPCPDCGGTGLIYCRTAEEGHVFGPETCGCMDDDEEPTMTTNNPPAPTGATARDAIADYFYGDSWPMPEDEPDEREPALRQADAILSALAEAGFKIVDQEGLRNVQDALVAAEVRISSERKATKAKLSNAYDIVTSALAARQPEGVSDGE